MVRAMNQIFREMRCKYLIIYIDNIISLSTTYEEHVEALRRVLQRLQDPKLCLKESKFQFFTKGFQILAHILIPEGLYADPQKVRKIFDFPKAKDKKNLQVFLAIVNYLSKFLPHLASVAIVLTYLQGTTHTCGWTDTCADAFNQCKDLISSGQLIKTWNSNSEEPKYVISYTSDIGFCSWLVR